MPTTTSIDKWRTRRALLATTIAFVCSCGRTELATVDERPIEQPPTSNCHYEREEGDVPGCTLHATDVNGADLGPTTLTIQESPPGPKPIDGYWIAGSAFVVVGEDGNGHWFQVQSEGFDELTCGTSVPLGKTTLLRWWGTATDFWVSKGSTFDVIAYAHGDKTEKQPIHFEAHDVPMVPPESTDPGGATSHATGTFTADISCRLEKFQHIAPD